VRFRTLPQLRTPDVAARDRTCLGVGVSKVSGVLVRTGCGLAGQSGLATRITILG